MERIVVGVDGSQNSMAALRWAIEEGVARSASVVAVRVWHLPYTGDVLVAMPVIDAEALEESYRAELSRLVGTVDTSGLAQPVDEVVAEGAVASVLMDASQGADLLVVGRRGHGGFLDLLLGSVSNQLAAHAACAVVIVPGDDD